MTLYEFLKLLHIAAAIVWVGGAVTLNVIGTRMWRARASERVASFGRDTKWLGDHIYIPSIGVLLVVGIWMVIESPAWNFGQVWVLFGLGGIAATGFTGALFLGPGAARMGQLIDERGPDDPEVLAHIRRILTVSRLDLLVLTLVVVDMVVKPFL
jgi:uncharacterized membrane protein